MSVSSNNTPTKLFDNIVPYAVTPTRPMGDSRSKTTSSSSAPGDNASEVAAPTPDDVLEGVLPDAERAAILSYRGFMKQLVHDDGDEPAWAAVLDEIKEKWATVFPEGRGYLLGFRVLEGDVQQPVLLHIIPYLRSWIFRHFEQLGPGSLPKFVAALTFGVWLMRSIPLHQVITDHGFLLFQSMVNSNDSGRLITRFISWFSQYLSDNRTTFATWSRVTTVPEGLLMYIMNDKASDGVYPNLCTIGYNDCATNLALPFKRAIGIFEHLLSNPVIHRNMAEFGLDPANPDQWNTQFYKLIMASVGVTADSNEMKLTVPISLIHSMNSLIEKSGLCEDAVQRATCRSVWGIAILVVVFDQLNKLPAHHPKCTKDPTVLYCTIYARTTTEALCDLGKVVKEWDKLGGTGSSQSRTLNGGSSHSDASASANKRQRVDGGGGGGDALEAARRQ